MPKLAVLILTLNEEKNIKACIESVSFADEIVVVDSGSNDNTVEIAKRMGATVVVHKFYRFDEQRNIALEYTDAEWVFYLDADERVTTEAAQSIKNIIALNSPVSYSIKRVQIMFGQKMKYGGHAPDYSLRIFPRDKVKWSGVVHEAAICDLPVEMIEGYIEHYPYDSWEKYFDKFNQYTTMNAEKAYKRGKRISFVGMLLHAFMGFLKFYVLKMGFLEGKLGLILALNHFFYTMNKYVKLYEIMRKNKQ